MKQSCTIAVLDVYPRSYWWPLSYHSAKRALKMASRGDRDVLIVTPRQGWVPHPRISGDLWVFSVVF